MPPSGRRSNNICISKHLLGESERVKGECLVMDWMHFLPLPYVSWR